MTQERLAALFSSMTPEKIKGFVEGVLEILKIVGDQAAIATADATPGARDYRTAEFDRSAPAGGWMLPAEVKERSRLMAEAIAAEKWEEAAILALKVAAVLAAI
jgi:hypothetical protein